MNLPRFKEPGAETLGVRIVSPKEPSIDLIRILSEGTYTSFPQALKEFVSNSHDAYATEVALRFDDDFSTLSIRDNGTGMSSEDFTNVFASIARSGRSSPSASGAGRFGRERIGRFGIGALAVVGTADRFTIARTRYRCVSANESESERKRRCGIPSKSYARSSRMAPSRLRCLFAIPIGTNHRQLPRFIRVLRIATQQHQA